ncbi:tyrosine-protein kinase family protein [Actinosynnema pretiosum]|uniref:CobQ/CobB/MinD/ParA nucleotide binding domain-containing protein n=1 Tax=Actinosynnema pretiosum TaxID=42197 RepID=A0A290Z2P5_9PSEU|nr:ParA family protein [Actinosynnema pretiosum]ATE53272.1 hypothetical protein CNX65_08200 [Actinosynnema pretiosum]
MPGTVVTFYSYKGGVGRSFALANVAVLLARWGHRVLCVDWDLEAPGLQDYFRELLHEPPASGVVDLVDDFRAHREWTGAHVTELEFGGTLHLLAAGDGGPEYAGRIQQIDWDDLYKLDFGAYLERCRARWVADYDFVLLDSRTGITDIGGICTAHLPDYLVVLYTANEQSIRGVVDIAKRSDEARDRLPYDRSQLTVLPLLSRFDAREEYDRADWWRQRCAEETSGLFDNWLNDRTTAELMIRQLTLPYVSYWSFGEHLSVLTETEPGPEQISYPLETVAALVAHRFDHTAVLADNRDTYVSAARNEKREFTHDIRISAPRGMRDFAKLLVGELRDLGLTAQLSMSGDRSLLSDGADTARHLCLLVDGEVSRWQSAEVELFLRWNPDQDRRVVPLLTADTEAGALPGSIRNLRSLRLAGAPQPFDAARGLAAQLAGEQEGDGLADVLSQAHRATLRPPRWELVDDILRATLAALEQQASDQLEELTEDLVQAIKPRANDEARTGPPASTRALLDQATRENHRATRRG